jgi:hypothetical protein
MLTDAAPYLDRQENTARLQRKYRRPAKPRPIPPAQAEDALAAGTCTRCGYPGPHETAGECINALRDRLARFE